MADSASGLEAALRETIRALVREELRIALADQKPDDEFLTTGQASRLAKVSVGSVRRWIRLGKLARHRVGRTLRINRAELERFLRHPGPDRELTPEEQADLDFR